MYWSLLFSENLTYLHWNKYCVTLGWSSLKFRAHPDHICLRGSLISARWHYKHTCMHKCPHDKGGDHLMLFTLYSPLKDTDLYQDWPALCVPPSSPPICHWVMERLLMLLKGQQHQREMQRMLNTKPMAPDTPHPSMSALGSLLFARYSTTELQALRVTLTFSGIILTTSQPFRGFLMNTR